ncbi:hypothetical protein [Deinococcus sp.]|uniref:hypothetical protein n=1 Tax=Deinococcus sp. TaxID=47478 RepID=UPI003C7CEC43
MTVQSKQEAVQNLTTRLTASGVTRDFAREYALQFMRELEGGRVLRFADLGQLRLEGGQVVTEPLAQTTELQAAMRDLRTPVGQTSVYTVEDEAGILQLMNGGYSRRAAEKAVVHNPSRAG